MKISNEDWQRVCDDLLIQHPASKGKPTLEFRDQEFEAQIFSSSPLSGVRRMGAFSIIRAGATLSNLHIGRFCAIGPNLVCGAPEHPLDWIGTSSVFLLNYDWTRSEDHYDVQTTGQGFRFPPATLGSDVWIGRDVFIKHGINIGHGAVVAAKSVVTKDVPPYAIVGGNPAKVIRYRFDDETISRLLAVRWWDHDPAWTKTVDVRDVPAVLAHFEEQAGQIAPLRPKFVRFEAERYFVGQRDG